MFLFDSIMVTKILHAFKSYEDSNKIYYYCKCIKSYTIIWCIIWELIWHMKLTHS